MGRLYKPVDVELDDDNTGIFQAFLAAAKAAQKCDDQFHSLLSLLLLKFTDGQLSI